MAETDYARLSCIACAASFAPTLNLDGSLRKNHLKVCGRDCKNQIARSPRPTTSCRICGAAVEARNRTRMYCSNACKLRAHRVKSTATHATARRIVKQHKAERRQSLVIRQAEAIKQKEAKAARVEAAKQKRLAATQARWSTPCEVCRSPLGKRRRRWCSGDCYRASPENQAQKAIEKARRRARSASLPCERFSPLKVFARDGWACRLCGIPTPKAKRGGYENDAPELDHILPLSRGGHHTLANTQCLCRACNGWKSDRLGVTDASKTSKGLYLPRLSSPDARQGA